VSADQTVLVADSAAASGKRQAAMPFIMATVLIDMVAIGLLIPVLPKLVGSFEPTAAAQVGAYALIAMAFGCANFIASPILGALSDRYGRRPVLLIGFSGMALSFFVTALATSLWMLVVVRLISGSTQANIAVANAYVSDITAPADRAKRFGMLGAMFGLGFIGRTARPGSAACWAASTCACRSTAPARWPSATGSTATSCCPNRCRPSAASRSAGHAPTRSVR